ncbi:MAG: hypothetical protein M1819_003259 [Sarea resinae]|nr:MAG: hypothetical protein M1819_003259 [Sarea resinae]
MDATLAAFYAVQFYPYTAPGVDPVFAVVGERQVIICRPSSAKGKAPEVIRWFKDEDDIREWFKNEKPEDYAKRGPDPGSPDLTSCVWSQDLETGDALICVAGGSPKIKVLNVRTGELKMTLIGHGHEINDLVVSPSSPEIIASASVDHSIRLWTLNPAYQANPCLLICAGEGHKESVLKIAFHHSGRYLISGGMDYIISLWVLPELSSKQAGSDKKILLHYPHFSTSAIHSSFVDCVEFYGDMIISRSAQEDKIVLWKINGFSSDKPYPNPFDGPTSHDFEDTRSSFGDGYQRLLQFQASKTDPFYMRFGLLNQPGLHPILAMGNTNSRIYMWDLQRLEVWSKNGGVPWAAPLRRSRKQQGPQREESFTSNTSSGVITNSNDGPNTSHNKKYNISDPFGEIEPHTSATVPRVSFATRQIAWSVGGEWMVAVGDNGMIAIKYPKSASVEYEQKIPRRWSSQTSTAQNPASPANGHEGSSKVGKVAEGKAADRQLFLSVLSSTSTKREARSYLSRFKPSIKPISKIDKEQGIPKDGDSNTVPSDSPKASRTKANLDSPYPTTRAVQESPVFDQYQTSRPLLEESPSPIHVALVKLRSPQLLDRRTLRGVGQTLSQLGRLGMTCVVVSDCEFAQQKNSKTERGWHKKALEQAGRVVDAIEANQGSRARRLDNVLGVSQTVNQQTSNIRVRYQARVAYRDSLLAPLRRGIIPVIAPIGYTFDSQQATPISANEVVLALAKELAGISVAPLQGEDPLAFAERVDLLQKQTSLDRLIILDPLGGIPSTDRPDGSHVFINMEQEFEDIKIELLHNTSSGVEGKPVESFSEDEQPDMSILGASNPFSRFVESEIASISPNQTQGLAKSPLEAASASQMHLQNLELIQQTLAILPPTTSALLTTPEEAASSAKPSATPFEPSTVGTRRQRNALIHNLLTDKPAISSSLPTRRFSPATDSSRKPATPAITFIKRGMPLTILPNPRKGPWQPPHRGRANLSLHDPRIDLPRLIHLINDSFGRKLDVNHYLDRIGGRIAGIIIAGEYEGGALLTWETPPGVPDDGSEASRQRMVPYLDKFAVLKRSQGAGGVADAVFNAMVRGCFPEGVCWRSRRDNPVNKWYFERSKGTWQIPDSNWAMFWTTESLDQERFLDYEGVCRAVEPSWADQKAVVD